jgi:PhnB protein
MDLQPYLFFEGRTEEAIEFYKRAIGANVGMLMRFKDSPDKEACPVAPGMENKVMHAELRIGNATIYASDGRCEGKASFQGFALSLSVQTEDEAERLFKGLAESGQVQMPLAKTFWSPKFGMVADRFGVSWMVMVTQ